MLSLLILARMNGKMVGLKEGAREHQALEEYQAGRKKRGTQAHAVGYCSRYPIRDELGHTMKLGKLTDV